MSRVSFAIASGGRPRVEPSSNSRSSVTAPAAPVGTVTESDPYRTAHRKASLDVGAGEVRPHERGAQEVARAGRVDGLHLEAGRPDQLAADERHRAVGAERDDDDLDVAAELLRRPPPASPRR